MQGRHSGRHQTTVATDAAPDRARATRRRLWSTTSMLAGAVAACLAAVAVLTFSPAEAKAATVDVQLTLSGLASSDNPTGGSKVEVHPGDSVSLTSSILPTAGAPGGLGPALQGLVGGVANLQVTIAKGNNLPGLGGKAYTLRAADNCAGKKNDLVLHSLATGTYSFHYTVQKISLVTSVIGTVLNPITKQTCTPTDVTPTQNQIDVLKTHQVYFTDTAGYSGQIVAKTNPGGSIGVQLPSQSVSVKAGPISTHVTLPGATLSVTNPVPSITKKLGGVVSSVVHRVTGGAQSSARARSKPKSSNVKYTPPADTVPQKVLPHATHVGSVPGYGAGGANGGNGGGDGGLGSVGPGTTATPLPSPTHATSKAVTSKPATKPVDLATRDQLGGKQLPALLAILAIIAFAGVGAAYARLALMRRSSK